MTSIQGGEENDKVARLLRHFMRSVRDSWFDEVAGGAKRTTGEVRSMACVRWTGGRRTLLAGDQLGRIYRLDIDLDSPQGKRCPGWQTAVQVPELGPIEALEPMSCQGEAGVRRWVAVGSRLGGLGWLALSESAGEGAASAYSPSKNCQLKDLRALQWADGRLWLAPKGTGLWWLKPSLTEDGPVEEELERFQGILGSVSCLGTSLEGGRHRILVGTHSGTVLRVEGGELEKLDELPAPIRALEALPRVAEASETHDVVVATAFNLRRCRSGQDWPEVRPSRFSQRRYGEIRHLARAHDVLVAATDQGVELRVSTDLAHGRSECDWPPREWLPLAGGQAATQVVAEPLPGGGERDMLLLLATQGQRLHCLLRRSLEDRRVSAVEEVRALLAGTTPDDLLRKLHQVVQRHLFDRQLKEGAAAWLSYVGDLGFQSWDERSWEQFERLVCDMALHASSETITYLVTVLHDLSRRFQKNTLLLSKVEDLLSFIKRFCRDGKRFSNMEERLLRKALESEKTLPFENLLYLGMLATRGFDVSFRVPLYEKDPGEPTCFTPLWNKKDGRCPPKPACFLVATRMPQILFVVSWQGQVRSLRFGLEREYVHNVYVGAEDLYLFTSAGRALCLPSDLLLNLDAEVCELPQLECVHEALEVCAVCPFDDSTEDQVDRFFYADTRGGIGCFMDDRFSPIRGPSEPRFQITDLRSTRCEVGDKAFVLLTAACSDGRVRIFKVEYSREDLPRLERLAEVDVDVHDIAAITHFRDGLMVVATNQGCLYGLRMLASGKDRCEPRFEMAWNYRTAGAVNSLHWSRTPKGEECLLAGSQDQHLHIVDRAGRQVATIYVEDLPIAHFWFCQNEEQNEGERLIGEARIATYSNRVVGGTYLQRRSLLLECRTHSELVTKDHKLLRLRTAALREAFFRVAYCLETPEYADAGSGVLLRDMNWMIDAPADRTTTSYFVGLVRRLFARGWVGRLLASTPDGGSPYLKAVRIFEEARARWGIKDEKENLKLQLYWLRAMLRGIEDVDQFNTWWDQSKSQPGLASANALLGAFLEHDTPFLRFKSLEYLEALLFGRAGAPRGQTGILQAETKPAALRRASQQVLEALLEAVGRGKFDLVGDAYWIVDRICAVLARLLAIGPNALCACQLVFELRRCVPVGDFHKRLATVLTCFEYGSQALQDKAERWAELVHNSHAMIRLLGRQDRRGFQRELGTRLQKFHSFCRERKCGAALPCPWDELRKDVEQLFGALLELLSLETLEDFSDSVKSADTRHLLAELQAYDWESYSPESIDEASSALERVRARLAQYGQVASDDMYNGPFRAFHAGYILALEDELGQAQADIGEGGRGMEHFVQALFQNVLLSWKGVFQEQRDTRLLTDFQRGLLEAEVGETGGIALTKEPSREDLDYHNAFLNLFQRLFASGLADFALLLFYDRNRETVRLFQLCHQIWRESYAHASRGAKLAEPPDPLAEADPERKEAWLVPDTWREREEFLKADLENTGAFKGMQDEKWRRLQTVPLVERHRTTRTQDGERRSTWKLINHGIMLFAWEKERDVPQQLSTLPSNFVHGLALGHAYQENIRFQNRVFKIVSHNFRNPVMNIVGNIGSVLQWPDMKGARRTELLDRAYHHARRIRGITESVLCLSGRPLETDYCDFELGELIASAIRAVRFFASYKGIDVEDFEQMQAPIRSDEGKVYEVVSLVLDNAVKYSAARYREILPNKVGAIQVQLSAARGGGGYEIVVEDDGIGVDKGENKKLQQPFERSQRAQEKGVDGLGIGLFTCSLYLAAIGGRLNLRPLHEERGTRCTIFLPKRPQAK